MKRWKKEYAFSHKGGVIQATFGVSPVKAGGPGKSKLHMSRPSWLP